MQKPHEANTRYTPPIPRGKKTSPKWMGAAILGMWILGALVIILSYMDVLPDHGSGWYLVAGIVLLVGGLGTATQYH